MVFGTQGRGNDKLMKDRKMKVEQPKDEAETGDERYVFFSGNESNAKAERSAALYCWLWSFALWAKNIADIDLGGWCGEATHTWRLVSMNYHLHFIFWQCLFVLTWIVTLHTPIVDVLKSIPGQSTVDVSKRSSRIEGDLDEDDAPKVNDYVVRDP